MMFSFIYFYVVFKFFLYFPFVFFFKMKTTFTYFLKTIFHFTLFLKNENRKQGPNNLINFLNNFLLLKT